MHAQRPMPVILHHGREIVWEFKRHHLARGLRLKVYADGRVVVTSSPLFASEAAAERLVRQQADWVLAALARCVRRPARPPLQGPPHEYRRFKAPALDVACERVERFAALYGVRVGRISIRNQKTRWGSCSRAGNLSFHYKIALVPRPLADYLVVHELCHLRSFDHSPRFWRLVAQAVPEYKRMRKLLADFGGEED